MTKDNPRIPDVVAPKYIDLNDPDKVAELDLEVLDAYLANKNRPLGWAPENERPFGYADMPEDRRAALDQWVADHMRPRRCYNHHHTSYGYKHHAERDLGFYVSNLQMKVAMVRAGYRPKDPYEINQIYKANYKPTRAPRD